MSTDPTVPAAAPSGHRRDLVIRADDDRLGRAAGPARLSLTAPRVRPAWSARGAAAGAAAAIAAAMLVLAAPAQAGSAPRGAVAHPTAQPAAGHVY